MNPSVEEIVVGKFLELYGTPTNFGALSREYDRAFCTTDPFVLTQAVNLVVDGREYPTWPMVGELKKAVNTIAERLAAAAARERKHEAKMPPPPTDEQRERVDQLIRHAALTLKDAQPRVFDPRKPDWARGQKPAWEERLRTSNTARQFAGLPLDPNLKR